MNIFSECIFSLFPIVLSFKKEVQPPHKIQHERPCQRGIALAERMLRSLFMQESDPGGKHSQVTLNQTADLRFLRMCL